MAAKHLGTLDGHGRRLLVFGLLPTVSDRPRTDYAGIRDYFVKFQKKKPSGTIIESHVHVGTDWATDGGIYEFTFASTGEKVRARYSYVYVKEGGKWMIAHHHSSQMPEEMTSKARRNATSILKYVY